MKPVSLVTAWKAERAAGSEVLVHEHPYYELVFYYRGSGMLQVSDQCVLFSGQSVSLIPPDTPHSERHYADALVCCIGFRTEENLPELLFQDQERRFQTIADTIVQEVSMQPILFRSMVCIKLQELIVQLLRTDHTVSKSTVKDFQYVINYLTNNYFEKIQLQQFARDLHISYDYFQHRFKTLTGLSPQQFLVHQRLQAAAALLLKSDCSCTEIAHRCGFSTSAQFSLLFKKTHNLPPLQYRTKQQNASP